MAALAALRLGFCLNLGHFCLPGPVHCSAHRIVGPFLLPPFGPVKTNKRSYRTDHLGEVTDGRWRRLHAAQGPAEGRRAVRSGPTGPQPWARVLSPLSVVAVVDGSRAAPWHQGGTEPRRPVGTQDRGRQSTPRETVHVPRPPRCPAPGHLQVTPAPRAA